MVRLEIGAIGGVDPQAMEFCFDAVTRGTLAEGAHSKSSRRLAQGWCLDCDKTRAAEPNDSAPVPNAADIMCK